MNKDELRALIRLVEESQIDELEIRRWGRTIRIAKNSRHPGTATRPETILPSRDAIGAAATAPVESQGSAGAPAPTIANHEITSPMVGTFYCAPAPEAPPFVEVGDAVRPGQTICILEAMKLMNELECEVSGIVRKIVVENGEPVEYGQVLFEIEL
ncbi:MAG: acetyl-CoA carboxylase biotin carboxyl carrier protein [Gemmatimonadetes bacterium]|nr:acetyl-CoA carboxylase biotin carboxyl carrier protein [Gemmatimonadota bacterium]